MIGDAIPTALLRTLDGFRVLTFDPPGVGRSSRAPRMSLDEMAECGIEVLDVFGITRALPVIGHSQGAMVAMHLASTHPARVAALLLVSPAPSAASYLRMPGAVWRSPGFLLRAGLYAVARRRASEQLMIRHVLKQSFVNRCLAPATKIHLRDWLRPPSRRMGWTSIARTIDMRNRLPRQLSLLLAGRHDRQTPLACTRELQSLLACELEVFENSGHYPFMEEPEAFGRRVRAFLKEERPK